MRRTLLKIIRLLVYGVISPVVKLLKVQLHQFYLSQKPKLTLSYWHHKWSMFRQFSWKEANVTDFMKIFRLAYKFGLWLLLFLVIFYGAIYIGALGHIPSRNELKSNITNTASEVYSADSVLLGRYYIQDRTNIKFDDIATPAISALIATEDVRFYEHEGVDVKSLFRVLVKSILLQDESSGGGSTLSQQLAKNLYPRKDYWFWDMPVNKMREMIIARKLEGIYSKEEILELYLNTVPMGGNLYGIERASHRFFNTSADSLKTEEAAVLIGMLKATTTYNPRLNLERSKQRRNVVLSQMAKYGYIAPAEADSLKQLPLTLHYRYTTHNDGIAPYFREQLRQELVRWSASKRKRNGDHYNLYTDGLKIYTTIDAKMQVHAERALHRRMASLQKQFDAHWKGRTPWGNDISVVKNAVFRSDRYKKLKAEGMSEEEIVEVFKQPVPMNVFSWSGNTKKSMSPLDSVAYYQRFLNAGLLSVEPETGYVKAWVGGIDHHFFQYDHIKSRRQVGSIFKPIVYAAALEKGIAPCTFFPNELKTYPEYDNWSPHNATEQYGGEYSMRGALAHSVNTVSAQLIMQAGVDKTVALAHRIGIQSDLPAVPSLALGTADLSLFEMVSAYSSFANNGRHATPVYIKTITDSNGKVLLQHAPGKDARRVLSKKNAAIMLQLMQSVVEEGSGRRLRSEFGLAMDIAGKTGTTQDQADGWFIGITPNLVTGVWVGAESPKVRFRTLALGQGSNTALPVWGEFMKRVSQDKAFAELRRSKFQPLPANLQASLSCESFRTGPPPKENFFDRLLDNVTEKAVQTYEEWKEKLRKRKPRKKNR
ncbi:penicillin-binding protein 1A [Pontibacter silvestris]|uniref:Penicillin-binding protein 1A n=1 Tax=Pontibacter silvestris TaxID=2305183 RepID=A0ABW4X2S0_9BACT|nr:PBP1A family penicillin-binding protein [Pontibacter silvestris]MCC9135098.1 PBP1A family penicillin-binding protein [Pontibacter silvestris]